MPAQISVVGLATIDRLAHRCIGSDCGRREPEPEVVAIEPTRVSCGPGSLR